MRGSGLHGGRADTQRDGLVVNFIHPLLASWRTGWRITDAGRWMRISVGSRINAGQLGLESRGPTRLSVFQEITEDDVVGTRYGSRYCSKVIEDRQTKQPRSSDVHDRHFVLLIFSPLLLLLLLIPFFFFYYLLFLLFLCYFGEVRVYVLTPFRSRTPQVSVLCRGGSSRRQTREDGRERERLCSRDGEDSLHRSCPSVGHTRIVHNVRGFRPVVWMGICR